jgi:F-type H+-transporting ATPase subunit alpha
VSRVGGSAQIKTMRAIAGTLRLDLAQYRELAAFAQFGSDLDRNTQKQLNRGRRLVEILKQPQYQPMRVGLQVFSVFAGTNEFLDDLKVEAVRPFEAALHQYLLDNKADLVDRVEQAPGYKPGDDLSKEMNAAVEEFKKDYVKDHPDVVGA